MVQRSWTGQHKQIERLRCAGCGREVSGRAGTLMVRRKLPEETVARWLQCQRWGVCEAGTVAICGVAIKTGYQCHQSAARRAALPHAQVVWEGAVQGVPWDEAPPKLRPKHVAWVHTALAMGSGFLLGVDCGPRTQDTAAALLTQVVARVHEVPLGLTEGGKAYTAALLQGLGRVYRSRQRGTGGRQPPPRLVAPTDLSCAQVVQVRNTPGRGVEVSRRVVCDGPRRFSQQLRLRPLGTTIQTACRERWYGPLLRYLDAGEQAPRVPGLSRFGAIYRCEQDLSIDFFLFAI